MMDFMYFFSLRTLLSIPWTLDDHREPEYHHLRSDRDLENQKPALDEISILFRNQ